MSTTAPVRPAEATQPTGLSHTLLRMSLTAIALLRPLYDEAGKTIRDFAWVYLNPAAQQLLQQPERPAASLRTLLPTAKADEVVAGCRQAFETGEPVRYEPAHPTDGLAGYFVLVAQRHDNLLVVNFTDPHGQPGPARAETRAHGPGQPLRPELAATNEALRARNDEFQRANVALRETQQQLHQLNQQLEARVRERTQQLEAARAAAEHERAQLQALLTQAPVAIALFQGEDVRVAAANIEMAAIWGTAPEHVVGRPLLEGVPELQGQGFDELLRQVMRTQVPLAGTETPALLQRNGELRTSYYNFVYQPLYTPDGQVLGVIDVAVDVTEQVRARQQVEQLNAELEARVHERTAEALALQADLLAAAQRQAGEREAFYQVFEQTTAAVALLRGPRHQYDYVNPSYQNFFPNRQFVGHPIAEVVPEATAQGFSTLLDHVYQTGETFSGNELPFVFPGATPRTAYFNFTYQAYREAGQVVGISIFAFEVTEQVLLRQRQQRLLASVFEQAPVAIFVVRGQQYVFDVVNASMSQMLGMAPAYMLGKGYFELMPALEAQGYRQLLDQVWHTGQPYIAQEQAAQLPHHGAAETGYYNFTYVPLREADGQVGGILCVAVDVTAQVAARQQVQHLNQELTATNAELHASNQQLTRTNVDLDTFVYTASHDLKAPITNIEGIALALRSALPAEVQQQELIAHLFELFNQTVARFRFTIAQLTDLSKLQLAHAGLAEPVRLAEVLESVRLDLAPAIVAADAQLTVEVAPELVVSFSPANLRSVMYNLLSNAVKYRALDRPAYLGVRAFATGPRVTVQVQDNGLGLNAHQLQRLFGLFQRLHTHVEGTGVGLYITKRLVENGGGTIAVASQEGAGTTFTLTFPA